MSTPPIGIRISQLSQLPQEIKDKLEKREIEKRKQEEICPPKVVHLSSESDDPLISSVFKVLKKTHDNTSPPPKEQPSLQSNIIDLTNRLKRPIDSLSEENPEAQKYQKTQGFDEEIEEIEEIFSSSDKVPSQSIFERLKALENPQFDKLLTKINNSNNVLPRSKNSQQYEYFEACKRLKDFQKLELPRKALNEIFNRSMGLSESSMACYLPENNSVEFKGNNDFDFIVKKILDFPDFYYSSKENKYKGLSSCRRENLYCIGKMLEKIRDYSGMDRPERLNNLIDSMTGMIHKTGRVKRQQISKYLSQLNEIW